MIQTNLEFNFLENGVTPTFARHETFHPRWGWLKKGFDVASNDSNIFNSEDAPVRLGVGKNMVRSLRYWCYTFKIIDTELGLIYQPKNSKYYRFRFGSKTNLPSVIIVAHPTQKIK
ncbi:DUF4007 family protein [Geminocystis sp. GBBB08]|uniref:DUF4007 family protein n=1 Tax=Geminocystis sp. GBBB08 TaxID=2604140 RepID=UPI0027E2FF7F|nr:DUF4007 family protein [Geminocystis sp. GBBB08]